MLVTAAMGAGITTQEQDQPDTTTATSRPKRTPAEQQLLDEMVRVGGMSEDEVQRYAELILIQARMVGELLTPIAD